MSSQGTIPKALMYAPGTPGYRGAWMETIATLRPKLKENGTFFLNVGGKPTDPWIALDLASRFRAHYVLQNTIHWIKSIAIPKDDVGDYPAITDDIAVGHYQPVNSNRYLSNCHEYIFHFTKKGTVPIDQLAIGVKYQDKTNMRRTLHGRRWR